MLPLCQVIPHTYGQPFDLNSQGEPSFLFTVRSLALRNHAGEVSWPGGVFDPDMDVDKDDTYTMGDIPSVRQLQNAAIRETLEELPSLAGISKNGHGSIEVIGRMSPVPDKTRTIQVSPFVGYIGTVIAFHHPSSIIAPTCLSLEQSHSSLDPIFATSTNEKCTYYHCSPNMRETRKIEWGPDEVSAVFTMSLKDLSRLSLQQWITQRSQFTMPVWCGPPKSLHMHTGAIINDDSSSNDEVFRGNNVMVDGEGVECFRVWGLTAGTLGYFLRHNVKGFREILTEPAKSKL